MTDAKEDQCILCGASYQPKNMARKQKYCSVECRERHRKLRKEAERAEVQERHCPICGKAFQVENEANRRKYCSGACRKERNNARNRKTQPIEKQCAVCGETFQCGTNSQKYCSAQCRQKVYPKKGTPISLQCPVCGVSFTVEGRGVSRRIYCSRACLVRSCKDHSSGEVMLTQSQIQGKSCLNCDTAIDQTPGQKRKRYCGIKCERQFYYRTSPDQRAEIQQLFDEVQGKVRRAGTCAAERGRAGNRAAGRNRELTQAQLDGKSCLNCGREISQTPRVRQKMFCCKNCCRQFNYNTSPEQRTEIKQRLWKPPPFLTTYICKCCGKEFEGERYPRRVYCSRECNNKSHSYAGSEKQVEPEEFSLSPSSATQRAAKEMHAAGKKAREIADTLGCNVSTVQGWLRNTRQKTTPAQHRPFSEPYYRYIHARSAAEWLAVLNDEMRCTPGYAYEDLEQQEKSVVFVCGTVYLTKSLYALVGFVEYELGMSPTDGSLYVFCNPSRNRLKCFRWDGAGFQETKRERDYGSYVWPGQRHGRTIAVTPAEFEFILYGSQQKINLENP